MKFKFKLDRIIMLILALAILMSIFAYTTVLGDEDDNDVPDNGIGSTIINGDDDDDDDDTVYEPTVEANFRQVASRGDLRLYVDDDLLQIRVVDLANGTVWYSTPQNFLEAGEVNRRTAQNILSLIHLDIFDRNTARSISIQLATPTDNAYTITEIDYGIRIDLTDIRTAVTDDVPLGIESGVVIPLEITLVDGGLRFCIVASEIQENRSDRFRLATVRVMPFFGAGGPDDDGYLLFPDGSGTLVYFNQDIIQDHGFPNELQPLPIYGWDAALNFRRTTSTENLSMPVFGLRKNNDAFIAVVTESAPNAQIRGTVAGNLHNFNQAAFEYIHRTRDQVFIRERTWQRQEVRIIDTRADIVDRFSVTYFFVDNADPSYVGMALRYQQYLIENHGMSLNAINNSPRMYVDFIGGVRRIQNFMGFPRNTNVPITRFSDVTSITRQLYDLGVTDVTAILTHWSDNTTTFKIPESFSPESALGGRSSFNRMANNLYEMGAQLFPDVNLVQMKANSSNTNVRRNAIQGLDNSPQFFHPHNPSTLHPDTRFQPFSLVDPRRMDRVVNRMYPRSQRFNLTGLSATTMGNTVYSSLGRTNINRTHTQNHWTNAFETLSQNNLMHFSNPNAYAFPFASDITSLPTTSSRYNISSRDVPFMQIALAGLVNLGSRPINAFYNYEYQALRALETGTNLKFTFGARNFEALINTPFEHLNYINYSRWIDDAARLHNRNAEVLSQITDRRIIEHEEVNGISRTVFGDGTTININFTAEDARVNGVLIQSMDFNVVEPRTSR